MLGVAVLLKGRISWSPVWQRCFDPAAMSFKPQLLLCEALVTRRVAARAWLRGCVPPRLVAPRCSERRQKSFGDVQCESKQKLTDCSLVFIAALCWAHTLTVSCRAVRLLPCRHTAGNRGHWYLVLSRLGCWISKNICQGKVVFSDNN